MGVYYPQGVVSLRVILEDFGDKQNAKLQRVHAFSVIAKSLRVNLNSYYEADTFSCEIDFKSFPFDPRSIRSAGVTVHVEDRKRLFKTDNSLNLIQPTSESIIFQGFIDDDEIKLSEDSRIVTLEGRDFTSLLLDQDYLGNEIPLTLPVDKVLRNLLDELEQTKLDPAKAGSGLRIENQTGDAVLPTLAELGLSMASFMGHKNGRPRRSYWDMIQEIVSDAALIAYVSIDRLVISKPRAIYSRADSKIFIYGKNLKELNFKRKLGRQKGFNIRVLSLNVEKKEVIEAKIPLEAKDEWLTDVGIRKGEIKVKKPKIAKDQQSNETVDEPAPYYTFRVRNIASKDHLIEVGQKIFEEVGRQELGGKLVTKEMQTVSRNNNVFDATKFRVGTPIEVLIDQGDLEGLANLQKEPNPSIRRNKIKQFLIANHYDPKVAEAFADSLTKYDTPFYTKSVQFNLEQSSGFTMDIDFINFIEIPRSLAGK